LTERYDSSVHHPAHVRSLTALAGRNRLRQLAHCDGWDLSSNDYLGLAGSAELREDFMQAVAGGAAMGSGGSRLLRGNHPAHTRLEDEAASMFGAEASLYFSSGFLANAAIFSTLPQRGDIVVHDALIHASVHDGMRLSRAEAAGAAHNDADAFNDAIVRWRRDGGTGRPWLAVESLYSMDGDTAPLDDLVALADRHDGVVVIDEAHATGVLGPDGCGLGAHLKGRPNVISLHTCGKALGLMGALVCAPRVLVDFLVNRCRPFIYTTAPSPLIAEAVRLALMRVLKDEGSGGQLRRQLHRRVRQVGAALSAKCGLKPTGTHIQPILVGRDYSALQLADGLQKRGYDIRAIRPPTVPEGTARLRMSLTLNVPEENLSEFVDALAEEQELLRS
jgi:8-amino-7-oxononanoate synthase